MPAPRSTVACLLRIGVGVLLATASNGCFWRKSAVAVDVFTTMEVSNRSFFDVVIYALPSPASSVRVRLGNVIGNSTSEIRVPQSALRQGHSLVLYLHAIGSRGWWVSPEISLGEAVRPCLDIYSDMSGDLSRSVLYARIAPDSASLGCSSDHSGGRNATR